MEETNKIKWKRRIIRYGCGQRFIEYIADEIPNLVICKCGRGYDILIDGNFRYWRKKLEEAKSFAEFIYRFKI